MSRDTIKRFPLYSPNEEDLKSPIYFLIDRYGSELLDYTNFKNYTADDSILLNHWRDLPFINGLLPTGFPKNVKKWLFTRKGNFYDDIWIGIALLYNKQYLYLTGKSYPSGFYWYGELTLYTSDRLDSLILYAMSEYEYNIYYNLTSSTEINLTYSLKHTNKDPNIRLNKECKVVNKIKKIFELLEYFDLDLLLDKEFKYEIKTVLFTYNKSHAIYNAYQAICKIFEIYVMKDNSFYLLILQYKESFEDYKLIYITHGSYLEYSSLINTLTDEWYDIYYTNTFHINFNYTINKENRRIVYPSKKYKECILTLYKNEISNMIPYELYKNYKDRLTDEIKKTIWVHNKSTMIIIYELHDRKYLYYNDKEIFISNYIEDILLKYMSIYEYKIYMKDVTGKEYTNSYIKYSRKTMFKRSRKSPNIKHLYHPLKYLSNIDYNTIKTYIVIHPKLKGYMEGIFPNNIKEWVWIKKGCYIKKDNWYAIGRIKNNNLALFKASFIDYNKKFKIHFYISDSLENLILYAMDDHDYNQFYKDWI